MRIIGGQYRGKKLFSPLSNEVRPTSDRAREALFNILNSLLDSPWADYTFLDVFGGTGAVALEALSRGAKNICLVDINPLNLQKNTTLFPAEKHKINIVRADACHLPLARQSYDIAFLDAPYQKGLSEKALSQLHTQNWLTTNALCIVEVENKEQITVPDVYKIFDERVYGLAKIIFMRYCPEEH